MKKIDFIVKNLAEKDARVAAAKATGITERTMLNIKNNKTASPVSTKLLLEHFNWGKK